jgi:hypothetical protein
MPPNDLYVFERLGDHALIRHVDVEDDLFEGREEQFAAVRAGDDVDVVRAGLQDTRQGAEWVAFRCDDGHVDQLVPVVFALVERLRVADVDVEGHPAIESRLVAGGDTGDLEDRRGARAAQ